MTESMIGKPSETLGEAWAKLKYTARYAVCEWLIGKALAVKPADYVPEILKETAKASLMRGVEMGVEGLADRIRQEAALSEKGE